MREYAQSPRDKILWVLTNFRGKITQRELGRRTGIRRLELDTILGALEKDGQVTITLLRTSRNRPKKMIALKGSSTRGFNCHAN